MGRDGRVLYWGWWVVLAAFLIMGVNYGGRYCFGIFVKPMALEYQWSRSVISAGMSILVLAYGIGGILSGRLIDRIAPRWLITAGSVITATGLLTTVWVREPWQFYLTYGVLGGLGSSCLGVVVCNSSVAKWFVRRRGIAIGVATIGVGVGTMLLAPLGGYVVKAYGWRGGFLGLGVLVLVVGVLIGQWLMGRTRPEEYGLLPDGDRAPSGGEELPAGGGPEAGIPLGTVLRDSRFWILSACYSLAFMAEMSAMVHQVAYALDQQIDRVAAASSLGMIGVASVAGRFFFGWFSDRLRDAKYASALGFLAMALGMLVLLYAASAALLFVYALLFGFGYGSMSTLMPYLLADRFGRHSLGSAYGMLTFVVAVFGSLGPVLAGYLFDLSGSYTPAWLLNLAVLAAVSALILTMKPRRDDARV
jgi:sugar phosphate permease